MTQTVTCCRCGREARALQHRPPLPGPLADEVVAKVCADCWLEWEKNEVMVINELRLNFMDPRSAEVLHQKLREFLGLDGPASAS
jgi:Fe-S cluster biosynthesis and repair protein YggX